MESEYIIEGMTCNGCVASVQKKLVELDQVKSASVTLDPPRAVILSDQIIPLSTLQDSIGKYTITLDQQEIAQEAFISKEEHAADLPPIALSTYKPLILIVLFILGVSILAQYPFDRFSGMLLMRHFMAGFFIVFAFFKLLNLEGFASSYSMYDIVARNWNAWGFIYPFVELALGILYLVDLFPFETNIATIIILGVSSIGVIQSNLQKKSIKCACLGDVFNLPMSTVTIVEDLSMIVMAIAMLFLF